MRHLIIICTLISLQTFERYEQLVDLASHIVEIICNCVACAIWNFRPPEMRSGHVIFGVKPQISQHEH